MPEIRDQPAVDPQPYVVEQLRLTVDRLRESWSWLQLLIEPGRERSVATATDDEQAERLSAYGMQARAYRDYNLRNGRTALPPSPAAARVGVLDAQVAIHAMVLDQVRRVAAAGGGAYIGGRAGVVDAVVDALDWLVEGVAPAPWYASTSGVLYRQAPADRLDAQTAADVDRALQRADATARQAARVVGEDVRPLDDRCPACRQRSLQLACIGEDRRKWYVECISQRCRCAGDGCPCLQRVRYKGRRHAWACGELEGPWGLWAAIAAATGVRQRLGSTVVGHGGWSERRGGPA